MLMQLVSVNAGAYQSHQKETDSDLKIARDHLPSARALLSGSLCTMRSRALITPRATACITAFIYCGWRRASGGESMDGGVISMAMAGADTMFSGSTAAGEVEALIFRPP